MTEAKDNPSKLENKTNGEFIPKNTELQNIKSHAYLVQYKYFQIQFIWPKLRKTSLGLIMKPKVSSQEQEFKM